MAKRRSTGKRLGKTKPKRPPRDLIEALRALGPCPKVERRMPDELAEETAAAAIQWHRRRAEITATWRKRSRLSDPAMLQERHSPTVEIAVDDPAGKRRARRNVTRVRQSEAWRHNNLDAMQRQAETEMNAMWMALTVRLQVHTLRLDRNGGAGPLLLSDDRRSTLLDATWRDWNGEARRRRISRRVVIMVLTEPRTLREVEQALRLRRGRAIEIYRRGLDLWCELRGWPTSTACGQLAITS